MSRTSIPAALLSATLLCLGIAAAPAQSCIDAMRQTEQHRSSHIVAVADLRIPPRAWQHFDRARLAIEHNDDALFAAESAKALAAEPRFAEVYLLRANQEIRSGRSETAIQTIAAAREIQPDLPWSGILLAAALTHLHRYTEAIAELDRLHDDETAKWQTSFERARAEIGRRNPSAALHWSELALTAAPAGCAEVRLLHANAFLLAGRFRDAIAELEAYLTLEPRSSRRAEVDAAITRTRRALEQEGSESLVAAK